MEAGRFALAGTLLSMLEQLHACVKWDLVDRDFFIFSNFVRQYFHFWLVNFFQIFGDNYDQSDVYIYQFFKNSVGGEKNKKAIVEN